MWQHKPKNSGATLKIGSPEIRVGLQSITEPPKIDVKPGKALKLPAIKPVKMPKTKLPKPAKQPKQPKQPKL